MSQIEDAVFEAMQRLKTRALQQIVLTSAVADVAAQPVADRPTCPTCGVGWSRVVASGGRLDHPNNAQRWRWAAATPCALNVDPAFSLLDEEFELLPGELSASLAEGVARLGTSLPFAQAAAELAFFWGAELDETTIRRHTQAAGAAYVAEQAVEVERLERERPPAPPRVAVQYLGTDGAMIPFVGGEWAKVKTLAIGEVEVQRGSDRLAEAHTTNLSYFSRLADAETFTGQVYVETYRRGTESSGVVCALQDGAEWLQGLVDVLRPDAVRILDVPHAVEHLTAAAQPMLGLGTPQLKSACTSRHTRSSMPLTELASCTGRSPSYRPSRRQMQAQRLTRGIER